MKGFPGIFVNNYLSPSTRGAFDANQFLNLTDKPCDHEWAISVLEKTKLRIGKHFIIFVMGKKGR